MSDIVEKTLASFPKFLSENILGGSNRPNKNVPPRGFQTFINQVNSTESKYEEEQIVHREMEMLQKMIAQPDISSYQICDYLGRLTFCSMLGYDTSFIHIHAVKLAQKGTGISKRIGYMSVALMLHEGDEMIVLLINTIQKDLKSSNILDNYMALTAASQLVNVESIPLLLPLILDKLKHPRELVRSRAVHCLHKMFIKAPSLLQHHRSTIQLLLGDRDPGVISAVLNILSLFVQKDPEKYVSVGESLVKILHQVIDRSFPSDYEYRRIPLPWLQIQLLRILGLLGSVSESLSHMMYPVLSEVLIRHQLKENIAYAVLYECIITTTSVKPNTDLLNEVSKCVKRFLQSSSHNLRYLGIKALSALIRVDPVYATSHQVTVVECLDEQDEAIQRQTLKLLVGIANKSNVNTICSKLTEQLTKSADKYFKLEIASQISQLAANLYPDFRWYMETMHSVLLCVNTDELTSVVSNFIQQNYHQFDEDFRLYLNEKYLTCLQENTSPTTVLKLAVWVIGQTSHDLGNSSAVVPVLLHLLSQKQTDEELSALILCALTTFVVTQSLSSDDQSMVLASVSDLPLTASFLKQKVTELRQLIKLSVNIPRKEKDNKTCDFTLSFLDDDVAMAIENGAVPYRIKSLRQQETSNSNLSEAVYQSDYREVSPAKSSDVTTSVQSENSSGSGKTDHSSQTRLTGLNMSGVRRVWGQEGLICQQADSDKVTIPQEAELKQKKEQLAQALFEGISDKQQAVSKDSWFTENSLSPESREQFLLPKSDSSRWRAIHEEHQSQTNQITESQDQKPASEISADNIGQYQDSVDQKVNSNDTEHLIGQHDETKDLIGRGDDTKDLIGQRNETTDLISQHNETRDRLIRQRNETTNLIGQLVLDSQSRQDTVESERREMWVKDMTSSIQCGDKTSSQSDISNDTFHTTEQGNKMAASKAAVLSGRSNGSEESSELDDNIFASKETEQKTEIVSQVKKDVSIYDEFKDD